MAISNLLVLETVGSRRIMPKNLPGQGIELTGRACTVKSTGQSQVPGDYSKSKLVAVCVIE